MDSDCERQRILVTGGTGFIGSHVVDYLLEAGHKVTVFAKCRTLTPIEEHWLQSRVKRRSDFSLIEADIRDPRAVDLAVRHHDAVWHIAGAANIVEFSTQPSRGLVNILGTQNVLEAMKNAGISRLVFTSSSVVYGDYLTSTATERAFPRPVSIYGASKVACEAYISAYCYMYGIRALIFRLGNVVGARMRRGILHVFISQLHDHPDHLNVLGDGTARKSYILVNEAIRGIDTALKNTTLTPAVPYRVFNVASPSTTDVSTVARIVISRMHLSNDVEVRFSGDQRSWPGDQLAIRLSIESLRNLGWQPSQSSDDAIAIATDQLLDIYRARRNIDFSACNSEVVKD